MLARRGREVALRLGDDDIVANLRVRDGCSIEVVEIIVQLEGGVHRQLGASRTRLGVSLVTSPVGASRQEDRSNWQRTRANPSHILL